jgi:DNA-binding beta-propeller fold protein YncE
MGIFRSWTKKTFNIDMLIYEMTMAQRTLRLAFLIFLVALMSCGTKPLTEEIPELFWPMPPERPRIKFVDYIIGSLDVTGSRRGEVKRVLFGEEGEVGFTKPLFVDALNDVVYVTDISGVLFLDFGQKKFGRIGGGFLLSPTGIAVSNQDILYVGDSSKKKIFKVDMKAAEISEFSEDIYGTPGGIAVDEINGRVIVADVKGHVVHVYNLEGESLFSIGSRGIHPGELNFPYDVATDDGGNIYIVDSGNFRVQKFDKEGNFLLEFGSVGTLPGQFARPKCIALDSDGDIYVVDAAFSNFQIFDDLGRPLLAVGSVGIEPGQFMLPVGIAITEDDKVYVVDQLNKRIQYFQYIKYSDEAGPN